MMQRRSLLAAAAVAAAMPGLAEAQIPPPVVGALESLGDERYRLGRIQVDKRARRFTLPGRVLVSERPLEYLATTPGGMKAYEALLEFETSGTEFNLACILIGLEPDTQAVPPKLYRKVPRLAGPRVALTMAWRQADGTLRRVPAAQALLNADAGVDPAGVEWVYTGAPAPESQGRFAPDITGTLIGFVHDANTIIESVAPIGLGAYGSVRGHAMLPPVATPIELTVEAVPAR